MDLAQSGGYLHNSNGMYKYYLNAIFYPHHNGAFT